MASAAALPTKQQLYRVSPRNEATSTGHAAATAMTSLACVGCLSGSRCAGEPGTGSGFPAHRRAAAESCIGDRIGAESDIAADSCVSLTLYVDLNCACCDVLLQVKGKGYEGLHLDSSAAVEPVGPKDVLVRVRAVSLNYRDGIVLHQPFPYPAKADVIPTSDGSGEIVAVGSGVSRWKVGDRVAAIFMPEFLAGTRRIPFADNPALGGSVDGMLAQYRVVAETALVRLPDNLSFEQAATLPCAAVTAWNALHNGLHPLNASHTVLVLGTGGVSVFAAQIALASGARVIATSSSDEKLQRMQSLGVAAADCINYKSVPKWSAKVKELTRGRGVDFVIEVGGGATIAQSILSVRVGGEIVVVGFRVESGPGGAPATIPFMDVLMGGFNVRGVAVGSRADFEDLLAAIANNPTKFPSIAEKPFSFDKAADAYKMLESQKHFGKIVITVD
jgi:NADPH:quinone reductase-like Zn-dependent oxidoreductase